LETCATQFRQARAKQILPLCPELLGGAAAPPYRRHEDFCLARRNFQPAAGVFPHERNSDTMNRMNRFASTPLSSIPAQWLLCLAALLCAWSSQAQPGRNVVFERISQYHHIQVYDEGGIRTLSFNGSWETKMSLADPLTGHFEYTEYFQMPFLWNPDIKTVLMAGLGGGSTQRAFQHYFTNVMVDTVEIDPAVVEVAEKYFHVTNNSTLRMHTNDARQYLRLATNTYDVILMDAYSTTRFGSSLPPQLTTKEFFTIANGHLTTNGVLGYNVIGQVSGTREKLVAALFHTMKEVFPQVYMFPADESENIVFIATKSSEFSTWSSVQQDASARTRSGLAKLPTYVNRARNFVNRPSFTSTNTLILTDDNCPIEESLMQDSQ
jgi:spermidine synthase